MTTTRLNDVQIKSLNSYIRNKKLLLGIIIERLLTIEEDRTQLENELFAELFELKTKQKQLSKTTNPRQIKDIEYDIAYVSKKIEKIRENLSYYNDNEPLHKVIELPLRISITKSNNVKIYYEGISEIYKKIGLKPYFVCICDIPEVIEYCRKEIKSYGDTTTTHVISFIGNDNNTEEQPVKEETTTIGTKIKLKKAIEKPYKDEDKDFSEFTLKFKNYTEGELLQIVQSYIDLGGLGGNNRYLSFTDKNRKGQYKNTIKGKELSYDERLYLDKIIGLAVNLIGRVITLNKETIRVSKNNVLFTIKKYNLNN